MGTDTADSLTLSHTRHCADGSSLKTAIRDGYYARAMWATQASFAAGTTIFNLSPNTLVARRTNAKSGEEHHSFFQTDYITSAQWFGLKNSFLVGGEYGVENSSHSTYPNIAATKASSTVGNPNSAGLLSNLVDRFATRFEATTLGVYVQDTVELTAHWKLVGGLRMDRFGGDYDRSGNALPNNTPLSRSDKLLSKRLGLMYQPTQEVSYYAAYGTSFNIRSICTSLTRKQPTHRPRAAATWKSVPSGRCITVTCRCAQRWPVPTNTTSATPTLTPPTTRSCCQANGTPMRSNLK